MQPTSAASKTFSIAVIAAMAAGNVVAGCSSSGAEVATGSSANLSTSDAIARAEEWVGAQLHYCQVPNHQRDYDTACPAICNRTDNPAWDPYRSDCSGLVSYAWGIPAPGRITLGFAPYNTDVTHEINAADLAPGDAVNNREHVMLFKEWVGSGVATFIEEPGCASSTPYAHEFTSSVSVNGSTIHVQWNGMTATAIRYNGLEPGAPSAASHPDHLDVFARGTNDQLYHRGYDQGWHDWESLGGGLTSGPAASSRGPGRLDVVVRGNANDVWHRAWDNGWQGWEPLGGAIQGAPASVSWDANRLDVFARGTDNQLQHRYFQGGWSDWEALGGALTSSPAAASRSAGTLDVVARGLDNAVWHKWWDGAAWQGWESLGGGIQGEPAVVAWDAHRLDVFARGLDNQLYHRYFSDSAGWSAWEALGGALISGPSAASRGPNKIDVTARGTDNAVWHKWWDGVVWHEWESLGGATLDSTAVVSWGNNSQAWR